jgi:hypothetical protein
MGNRSDQPVRALLLKSDRYARAIYSGFVVNHCPNGTSWRLNGHGDLIRRYDFSNTRKFKSIFFWSAALTFARSPRSFFCAFRISAAIA